MIIDDRSRYELQAMISFPDVLVPLVATCPVARVAPLDQDLALIPVTDDVATSLRCCHVHPPPESGFRRLTGGLYETLRLASQVGPIAYVEADYNFGNGRQAAAVWTERVLAYGPEYLHPAEPFSVDGTLPIVEALRRLGAMPEGGDDEFAAVGLGRYRTTKAWHQSAALISPV